MDDDWLNSSDDNDDFIDQFFQELGSKPKETPQPSTSRTKTNDDTVTDIEMSSDDDPISDGDTISVGDTIPDRDSMVRNVQEKQSQADNLLSSPIKIPSIFLTEGEKNKRILRHEKQISEQLGEEYEKNRVRKETFENTNKSILSELNDNGSNYVFSRKHDSKIIEEYVQRTLSKDSFMATQRQFHFFNDVQKPVVDEKYHCQNPLLQVALKHLSRDADQFLNSLWVSKISLSSFLVASLTTLHDMDYLKIADKIMKRAYELIHVETEKRRMKTLFGLNSVSIDENGNAEQIEEIPPFNELMEAVGARSVKVSQVIAVSLKLTHYNTHTQLLLLRLSMIFHFYLARADKKNDFHAMLQYFLLTCSDFHLNKVDKENLCVTFVGPVFQAFFREWTSKFGSDPFIQEVNTVFSSLSPSLYGEQEVQSQKALEMHFNMLINLLHSIPPDSDAAIFVKSLIYKFLGAKDCTRNVLSMLTKVVEHMGSLGFAPILEMMPKYMHTVYKNFFKAQILAIYLNLYALDEEHHKTEKLMRYHEKLLDCKDSYQQVIGQVSYSSIESIPEKTRITLYLSDTYHTLDYIVGVLSKSGILPEREFFYDEEKKADSERSTPAMDQAEV